MREFALPHRDQLQYVFLYVSSCYDDTAFARAVIDYVSENYCVDPASIHLQGHGLLELMLGWHCTANQTQNMIFNQFFAFFY